MALSELTDRDAVLAAIREYDALGQVAFLEKYGYSPARRYQLMHDGKSYDSKAIVGVAFKYQFPERGALNNSEFSGGEATVVPLLQKLNFEIQTAQDAITSPIFSTTMTNVAASDPPNNPIQEGLEYFLATYPSTRSTVTFGKHNDLKNGLNLLRSALEALPAVRAHPRVRVSWSAGQGNYARVPWIALMDERETTSTQRGTYCVFLFTEDMSVYVVRTFRTLGLAI
jgi:5-methylcytosine-specific restriction enzyme B